MLHALLRAARMALYCLRAKDDYTRCRRFVYLFSREVRYAAAMPDAATREY